MDYFVPLSEDLFELQQNAASDGRSGEAKVWSVLLSQIWAGFSGYVRVQPGDLTEVCWPLPSTFLTNFISHQGNDHGLRPASIEFAVLDC